MIQGSLFPTTVAASQVPPSGNDLRDRGMQQAVEHADKTSTGWSDVAYAFLVEYLATHREFMTEDARLASHGIVPEPPSKRAWGSVIIRAAKSGLIKRIGFRNVKNAKAHSTPAAVWQRCE